MNRDPFRSMIVVGVEDGSFQKGLTRKTILAVALLRGLAIENVKTAEVTVDGLDATKRLVGILSGWKFDAVLLAGISFAGFNLIDPTIIHEQFKKPVIVITRTKPDNKAVKRALKRHFDDWRTRWGVFEKLGSVHSVAVLAGKQPIYAEALGASGEWVRNIILASTVCGRVPEPIRVARLIARGLS